jgi:hypothetical protein
MKWACPVGRTELQSNAPWDWQEEAVWTTESRIGNFTLEAYFVVITLTSYDTWKYTHLARLFYTTTENALNYDGYVLPKF